VEPEESIVLSAATEAELNTLIDAKLKARYVLKGAAYQQDGKWNQLMILPGNIDSEMTLTGGLQLLVGGVIYVLILYFFL